ncbi:MAG: hypothetical protein AABW54_02970 [Candidatus Micrarchaeota archaeon]
MHFNRALRRGLALYVGFILVLQGGLGLLWQIVAISPIPFFALELVAGALLLLKLGYFEWLGTAV